MIIYGINTCDTCRKVLKECSNAEFHDIRAQGFPGDLLTRAHAAFGMDLLNTRSTTWRSLDETQRKSPVLDLIRTHPTLMKRPLIEMPDGTLYLGWSAPVRTAVTGA